MEIVLQLYEFLFFKRNELESSEFFFWSTLLVSWLTYFITLYGEYSYKIFKHISLSFLIIFCYDRNNEQILYSRR